MVIKRFLIIVLLTFFVNVFFVRVLSAQEEITETEQSSEITETEDTEEEASYFIDYIDGELRFVQRLTWAGADFVLRYVVIIEQLEDGLYKEIERVDTEESFIEVSLRTGDYRYLIEVYDIFDDLSYTTDWLEFQVILAIQPEILSFTPAAFFLDESVSWEITVRGRYLLPDSVIYLVRGNITIIPANVIIDRNTARLIFSEVTLIPGDYEILVRNPGGLEATIGTFNISYLKAFDMNISFMYSPFFPLGELFDGSAADSLFSNTIYPLGAGIRFSFIPYKRVWGRVGAEFAASYSYMVNKYDFYSSKAQLLNTHVNLLYQLYFSKRIFSINAVFGGGFTSLVNAYFEYNIGQPTEKFTSFYPSIIGGLSFTWFFKKPYYFNAGIDYIHIFYAAKDGLMPSMLRPALSVGFQF